MLIASSINGFLFGLASGQPLLILGPTGPFLVFEEMVFDVGVMKIESFVFRFEYYSLKEGIHQSQSNWLSECRSYWTHVRLEMSPTGTGAYLLEVKQIYKH